MLGADHPSLKERIKAAGGVELAKRAVCANDAEECTKLYVQCLIDKLAEKVEEGGEVKRRGE